MVSKQTGRRKQVRRQRTDRPGSVWRWLRDDVGWAPLGGALVFFVAATVVALAGVHLRRYVVGQKTKQPIYAEVDFSIVDEQQTQRLRQAARASTPNHYRVNSELISRIGADIRDLYQMAQASETFEAFKTAVAQRGWPVDQRTYDELRSYAADAARFERAVDGVCAQLAREYTWDPQSVTNRNPASTADYVVVHPTESGNPAAAPVEPKRVSLFDPTPITNVTNTTRIANDIVSRGDFAVALRPTVSAAILKSLTGAPLLVYDQARTSQAMNAADQAVEPVKLSYERGNPLIPPRPDRGLTAEDLRLLELHDEAYRAFLKTDAEGAKSLRDREMLRQFGICAILLMCTVGLFVYVGLYQPRIFEIAPRTVALVVLMSMVLLAARLIIERSPVKEFVYAPPLLAASILAIAYVRRFAIGASTILAIMICVTNRADEAFLVTLILGTAATVYMLKEIRTRTRFIWVGFLSAGTVFLVFSAFQLVDGQVWGFAVRRAGWVAAGALLAALVTQAVLPLIESLFRIATPLTLLEWRDTTKPLLQRLASEAPGTYAHSLALSNIAEAACRTIGANALLAQVGALYHDIGKINKAPYFTENQRASINRHDNLAPTMSLLIIIGHVKDGVEMAKEYKLPRVLHRFIEEHHGTTVVRYFHHMAAEKQPQIASGKHDREVPEAQFRYPGPKPRSKESAVLMICDGVEGAVRALSEPTPGRIEQIVSQIITARLNDGQFDDCDITLRELHRVEESLVMTLCSQYHGRVPYPKAREKSERSVEEQQPAKSVAG